MLMFPGCRWSSEPETGSLSRSDTLFPSCPDTVGWDHSGGSHRPQSWPGQTSTSKLQSIRLALSLPPYVTSTQSSLSTFFTSLKMFSRDEESMPPSPSKIKQIQLQRNHVVLQRDRGELQVLLHDARSGVQNRSKSQPGLGGGGESEKETSIYFL